METVTQILSSDLSPMERLVWIAIKWHSKNGEGCRLSYDAIGKAVGLKWQQTKRLILKLEEKGYCSRSRQPGRCCAYTVKFPDPSHKVDYSPETSPTRPPSQDYSSRDDYSSGTSHPVKNDSSPLSNQSLLILNTNTKKVEEHVPPSSPKGGTYTKTKTVKPKPTRDPEIILAELDKIDLAKFHKDFPNKDVETVFTEFSETCLTGTAKKAWPNPYDYINFSKGFRTWLARAPDRPVKPRDPEEFDRFA